MPTKVQKERVSKLVTKWKARLLLNHWTVIVTVHDKPLEPTAEIKTIADMKVHDRYAEGRLGIYPRFWSENKATQEATIVHELIHLITEPTRDALHQGVMRGILSQKKRDDLTEKLTEHICKVVFKAHKKSCSEHII